ncbi:DMT family transporter [Wukongibacter sp. M2B1]|uniref:DMT family transporter n=1 Tax=Wukongibacter sp. M2B1 TaxID=3088895 RepID=UPI003D79964C
MEKSNAKLIVLIGVIFVSFSSIIAKSSHAPSLIISVYRMGFTVLLLLPSTISKNLSEIKKVDIKTFGICVVSGIFLALHFATWIASLKYTSVASSTVLVNTHPVFIVLGSFLILKERISKNTLVSIAIALTGSIIISTGDSTLGSNILYGDMLAILGAFFVAGYMLIGSIARQKLSVTTYTFIVYASSTITLIILSIFTNTPLYPYPFQEMLRFLMLAIFCTILGHSIFNWALEYVKPTYISTAVLGEPVFASLWAIVFFKEIPKVWQFVGSLVIIYGIYRYTKIREPRASS